MAHDVVELQAHMRAPGRMPPRGGLGLNLPYSDFASKESEVLPSLALPLPELAVALKCGLAERLYNVLLGVVPPAEHRQDPAKIAPAAQQQQQPQQQQQQSTACRHCCAAPPGGCSISPSQAAASGTRGSRAFRRCDRAVPAVDSQADGQRG